MLTVGVEGTAASIVDVAPLVLAHFGVGAPDYALGRQPPDPGASAAATLRRRDRAPRHDHDRP